jgi:hypothetical protein
VEAAAAIVGPERARRMATEYPRSFVQGVAPEIVQPEETPAKRSFLGRLFGRDR